MDCTRSRDAEHVKATAAFIENGRAYLCVAIGAGVLVAMSFHELIDPALCAAAVFEATGHTLIVPAGEWRDELRRLLSGRAAA